MKQSTSYRTSTSSKDHEVQPPVDPVLPWPIQSEKPTPTMAQLLWDDWLAKEEFGLRPPQLNGEHTLGHSGMPP